MSVQRRQSSTGEHIDWTAGLARSGWQLTHAREEVDNAGPRSDVADLREAAESLKTSASRIESAALKIESSAWKYGPLWRWYVGLFRRKVLLYSRYSEIFLEVATILERPEDDLATALLESLRSEEERLGQEEELLKLEEELLKLEKESLKQEAESAALYSLRATLEAVDSEGVQDCAAADVRAAQPGSEMSGIGSNPAADPGQGSSIPPPPAVS
ncbi:hypothetical protein [Anaplasma capra]|uniref:hypothetical protein n=1 Tax=Anaplasma capra TaxID=1562740 RepID=UPI0021D5F979|nr:hypothetical protein [Anaplasma capra]MCU7612548.1 hypothetical protein [Anaplasma capra]